MARDGILTLFGISDAKIWPLTADSASAYTPGTGVDVPGIQSISMQPEFLAKELVGDDEILDEYSKLRKITGSVKHAQISLPLLAILTGGANATSGTTPNEKMTFTWSGDDLPGYFKMEGQSTYLGGDDAGGTGDAHFIFYKCKMSNLQVEPQSEDYAMVSFDFVAIPSSYSGKVLEIEENETAVAVTVTADTTAPTVSSSSPADGASGVVATVNVTFTFDEDMMLSTMEAANFFLVEADGTSKAFAFSYDQGTRVATLNPTTDFDSAQVYIAGVTVGARDLAGNRLAAQHVINFTIA